MGFCWFCKSRNEGDTQSNSGATTLPNLFKIFWFVELAQGEEVVFEISSPPPFVLFLVLLVFLENTFSFTDSRRPCSLPSRMAYIQNAPILYSSERCLGKKNNQKENFLSIGGSFCWVKRETASQI